MNTTYADPLSLTVRSVAKPKPAAVNAPAHFLFIMPRAATQEEHALIFTIANSMTGMGYVYIASADHTTVEDRGQIRYLPFREGSFPSFGRVHSVFVLRDRMVATQALNEYRGAEGFLLEPRVELKDHMATAKPAAHPDDAECQHAGAFISMAQQRGCAVAA